MCSTYVKLHVKLHIKITCNKFYKAWIEKKLTMINYTVDLKLTEKQKFSHEK